MHTQSGLSAHWTFRAEALFEARCRNTGKHGLAGDAPAAQAGGLLKAMSFALIGVVNSLIDFAVFLFTLRYVTEPLPGERLDLDRRQCAGLDGRDVRLLRHEFLRHLRRRIRPQAALEVIFRLRRLGILGVVANTATLLIAAEFMR
jgi:hypothetical protein